MATTNAIDAQVLSITKGNPAVALAPRFLKSRRFLGSVVPLSISQLAPPSLLEKKSIISGL